MTWRRFSQTGLLILATAAMGTWVDGAEVLLQNGFEVTGGLAELATVMAGPKSAGGAGAPKVKLILLLDDGLRRTFVSRYAVREVREQEARRAEEIVIPQRVAATGPRVAAIGQIIGATPFDRWGRRTLTLNTSRGPIDVIVGITKITPTYTQVEGLSAQQSYVLDMRLATSSIPRATLQEVLTPATSADADHRLAVVRLFTAAERYDDAIATLREAIQAFPELENLREQEKNLLQLQARSVIAEIRLRAQAGQVQLAQRLAEQFPAEGVPGPILQEVRELTNAYQKQQQQTAQTIGLLDKALAQLPEGAMHAQVAGVVAEIKQELSESTLARMADLLRLAEDPKMGAEQQLSLAISGWLMGSGAGTENMAVSLSLVEIRDLVRRYLRSTEAAQRREVLDRLQSLEGATVVNLAKIVLNMRPPQESAGIEETIPGQRRVRIPGLADEPEIAYDIQLPPEYDSYRRYPTIVSLHGESSTPAMQMDWWAGVYDPERNVRVGQATRRGYIVITPHWSAQNQKKYEYSAGEHARVLTSLRDACRRFSIDVDRVYLSGHSMGGVAAWDIGLAHPDLWAGVIPIVAVAQYDLRSSPKYVTHYKDNAKWLPWYFISGELDGKKLDINGPQFDYYLTHTGYNAMVVEYVGRGHEHFSDEIQRIFTWMGLHQRVFARADFKCVSMRPWDNYFWWCEVEGLPDRTVVLPHDWPAPQHARAALLEGSIKGLKTISLRAGARKATVFLVPELVDFNQVLQFQINSQTVREQLAPSVEVLLEDVRTRGDRQHPFWAKKVFGG